MPGTRAAKFRGQHHRNQMVSITNAATLRQVAADSVMPKTTVLITRSPVL